MELKFVGSDKGSTGGIWNYFLKMGSICFLKQGFPQTVCLCISMTVPGDLPPRVFLRAGPCVISQSSALIQARILEWVAISSSIVEPGAPAKLSQRPLAFFFSRTSQGIERAQGIERERGWFVALGLEGFGCWTSWLHCIASSLLETWACAHHLACFQPSFCASACAASCSPCFLHPHDDAHGLVLHVTGSSS